MHKIVIISALFFCLQIFPMNTTEDGEYIECSIVSPDGYPRLVSRKDRKQMKVFYPLKLENSIFHSEHDVAIIESFLDITNKIKNGTIKSHHFPTQLSLGYYESRIQLSDYYNQFHRLQPTKKNEAAKALISVGQELKAEQLMVIFLSHIFNKNSHDRMFSSLMSSKEEEACFKKEMNKVCNPCYASRPTYIDDNSDPLVGCNYSEQKMATNNARNLMAKIKKAGIVVYNCSQQIPFIQETLFVKKSYPISNLVFSGDGSRLMCVENFKNSYSRTKGFTLFIWDIKTWQLLFKNAFLVSGNIDTLCCSHDGKKAVASVSRSELFHERDMLDYTYEMLIFAIDNHSAKIIHIIPIKNILKRIYWPLGDEFFTSSDVSGPLFDQWISQQNKKTVFEKFDFAQKLFLYGLYERLRAVKAYPASVKPFVVPEFSGYVAKFIMQSLPEEIKEWAQAAHNKLSHSRYVVQLPPL